MGRRVRFSGEVTVQVVGLRGGYHTAAVMGGVNDKVHAKRLAQASEVLIELHAPGEAPKCTQTSTCHCLQLQQGPEYIRNAHDSLQLL